MVKIELEIPRPWLTLCLCMMLAGGIAYANAESLPAIGGLGMRAQVIVKEAEEDIRFLRIRQEVLAHQEEILRYQLELFTRRHEESAGDPALERQMWDARQALVELLRDKFAAEERLKASLAQMWNAQGGAALASVGSAQNVRFTWPVAPDEGLSATFHDMGYRKRFHLEHLAIDIPTPQGTTIVAADDGVVLSVSDQGMGFNSLAIRHRSGVVTLYGHVSAFLVREGDQVQAGDPIALSGGLPGTPGAGWLTTGAHLHFQVLVDGQPVDPLPLLPSVPTVDL